jgi:hypothetical protein
LTGWGQVSAGEYHVASVKTDGTLWTWGRNNHGQLGQNIGITTNRSSPVQVGTLTNWALVSAGGASTAAVKTDGTLWAWGRNNYGQLGDSTVISRSSPVQIGVLTNWSQVSEGSVHTASLKSDGTLWMWGRNNQGQLGDNTGSNRSSPIQVGALTNWYEVSVGVTHTVALYGVV